MDNLIQEKKYFPFTVFTPRGAITGIGESVSKIAMIHNLMAQGAAVMMMEELSFEDYDFMQKQMEESKKKPNIIIAQGNLPKT